MTLLSESAVEDLAIQLLEAQGYSYFRVSGEEVLAERGNYSQVLLTEKLGTALRRINYDLPQAVLEDAVKTVQRIHSPELMSNNEAFHRLLTEGVPVTRQIDGNERGERVWLIDFENPLNNDFVVANQFTVTENHNTKRPDLVLFVNGLPLVVIELKNPADERATVHSAFRQIETYKHTIPALFTTNSFVVISDGLEARAGTISSDFSRFMKWKSADGKQEAPKLLSELEVLIRGMLNRTTLLDLVRHFIVFEKGRREDPETKQVAVTTVKKLASYHQYYAVNAAVASTLRASGNAGLPPRQNGSAELLLRSSGAEASRSHFGGAEAPRSQRPKGWHSRGYLPHRDELGILQSITFRLSDSLPQEKLRQIEEELLTMPEEERDSKRRIEIEKWLDAGMGCCALRNPALAEVVQNTFFFYDGVRYRLLAWCIMPNHVHVLIQPLVSLSEILRSWKGYTGRWAQVNNTALGLGIPGNQLWFEDYWDRYIRNERHLQNTIDYIHNNPVKAGLCAGPGDWLWSSAGSAELLLRTSGAEAAASRRGGAEAPRSQPLELHEDPVEYGLPAVKTQPEGDHKAGVIWHTQGSGKSLSMVFYTGKIVLAMNNPTVLVITDRNDLDDQLFDTFAASRQLLRQDPVQAKDRTHLKELLKVGSGGVVFSTIQKFQPEEGNVYEELSARENIVVIADEAHRTQYGFSAKTIDAKNDDGAIVGKKTVYGFAKYLRDALPNATYLGFTGTPIEKTDKNTPAVFGNYVDIYDIAQAVEDGATVRIYYESRLAKVALSEQGRKLIAELDEMIGDREEGAEPEHNIPEDAKAKWTKMEALIGSKNRIGILAKDIVEHFEARQKVFTGKGMIVSLSRRIAAELYNEIIRLRPAWHSDDLTGGVIKIVMTSTSSDGPEISRHQTTKEQRKTLAKRMKDDSDTLRLVIVCDMWLTGFDVPSLHTLYIDKPMHGHNLMQAIARVNRVYKDKPAGLVVDYLGIAADLKEALSFYSDSGGHGEPALAQEDAVKLMLEKLEIVSAMFHGFGYEEYFAADTARKLSLLLAAEEHILGLPDGKKRFLDEVTALSKAFAIAVPHEQAMDARDEVGFFQAVKARLAKFEPRGEGSSDLEMETTIRQVIDQALVSEKVVDIFDAAGIKKPDISILSDEFLAELKNLQHKNVAIELLKKLLNDEVKSRSRKNLVESRRLLERLEEAVNKYQNKILTAAEFMEELIQMGKEIVKSDTTAQEMGLSEPEYAFYTAVARNDSARELMKKDSLRELAVELFMQVRKNASIDWTLKEGVKAKLRVIIKRTLRKYGYPPDMQLLATETVLEQAELIASELTEM